MKLHRFLAKDAAHAVEQIRAELGPEAVVAHVRRVQPKGLANLWSAATLEVLACVPETKARPVEAPPSPSVSQPEVGESQAGEKQESGMALLERMGLLRVNAERVWETSRVMAAGKEPNTLGDELNLIRQTLSRFWRIPVEKAPGYEGEKIEVFVGPSGAGSTTVLCKMLVQDVLAKGYRACVWRLDGAGPNLSERLALQCEMLGVPMLREWKPVRQSPSFERAYVDLPGVVFRDSAAIQRLASKLTEIGAARVHLCLNAAYSTSLLVEQFRAFSVLPITDLVFTHLDEERSWGKLWNFVVGTHLPIRLLSAGQNVPGDLHIAAPSQLFEAAFSR